MRYEAVSGVTISKIGLGTWKIGGGSSPNRSSDSKSLAALRTALELGYTHFDTAEIYADGHAEELLGRAIQESRIPRESLFIVSKVRPQHLRYADVLQSCEGSLRRLGFSYLDLYLIHWPARRLPLSETFGGLNQLVADGKVRSLGVSNFDLPLLKAAEELSETRILTNQVPYSLDDRSCADNGLLAYCQGLDILVTAYLPLQLNRFAPRNALQAIADAHSATPYQIALAWPVSQPRVIAIPMSQDPLHQKQNLQAADITLNSGEMAQLA